ncbi:MAG: hypothetical protein HN742_20005 [Lentisphaerae bacterium]|jgi:hypothetical protein|nr:hypothetical protein [Lentisphaerota bacterium]MBT5612242.1 hypothetical protein [Lentisphaerota bacterium]MBT7059469.1 hypothetical protein [Lentisphaerota bacterium]MBT7844175.1 hypothetical protein [Lentisphaerota bacterium]
MTLQLTAAMLLAGLMLIAGCSATDGVGTATPAWLYGDTASGRALKVASKFLRDKPGGWKANERTEIDGWETATHHCFLFRQWPTGGGKAVVAVDKATLEPKFLMYKRKPEPPGGP